MNSLEDIRAKDLMGKFGNLAELVCDELILQAGSGYDLDYEYEVPFFNGVKDEIKKLSAADGGAGVMNVVSLGVKAKLTKEVEIYTRIEELIHEYDGEVSVVSIIGILDLLKDHVKMGAE